ncbi:gastrokine-1 [Oryctolagus cuniculus]|uniref:Gastrokine-1 n=1 Tax=Oryctolagus cuniculus TaxID=9986 RepID=G1SYV8_RABIT|nr:gastrokine-1 [Oryctolagus cuniculus]
MKIAMIFVGLLGLFIIPGLSGYNINISDDNNADGSGQQTVSVNNEHNVANVDNNNGWNSWNTLWDYDAGFAATRLFAKKSCIVHTLNKDAIPSIEALDALAKEKKEKGAGGPPPKGLVYSINPVKVDDLSQFGKHIAGMCQGVPTYEADEIQDASLFYYSGKCFNTNVLWILNISYCGKTVEN